MVAPDAVRELTNLQLTIDGLPGDAVFLAFSSSTRWVFDPAIFGVYLFGTPLRRVALGTIPPSGTLAVSLPVAALPVGVDADSKFLQIAVRTGGGPLRLGSAAWLSILDSSF
jgi:hypothetical protein